MARGVNKVILVGNCGKDPETKFLPSGNAVANISIATSESWKDKQTGQKQERTEWHNVAFIGRLAEIAGEYLRKGSKVYIEGSLRTRKWQDQSGQDRYTTEIIASDMQMLDSREGGQAPQQGYQQQAPAPQQNQQAPHQQLHAPHDAAQYRQNASAQNAAQSHSSGHGGFQNAPNFEDQKIPF